MEIRNTYSKQNVRERLASENELLRNSRSHSELFEFRRTAFNFKAKLLNNGTVIRNGPIFNKKIPVSYVEIDLHDKRDWKAIESLVNNNHCDLYQGFLGCMKNDNNLNNFIHKFFVLTRQKSDFENLVSRKILGVCAIIPKFFDWNEGNISWLSYIATQSFHNPGMKFKLFKYKGCGTTLLQNVVELISKTDVNAIKGDALPEAKEFYRKSGFNCLLDPESDNYIISLPRKNFHELLKKQP